MYYQEALHKSAYILKDKAMKEIENEKGLEAGKKIAEFFRKDGRHPHINFTFKEEALKRNLKEENTTNFAEKLAYLIAINEMNK